MAFSKGFMSQKTLLCTQSTGWGHQGHCPVGVAVRWRVPRSTVDSVPHSENRSKN
jgi:hypothetical protein